MPRSNSSRRSSRRDFVVYDANHERLGSPLLFNLSPGQSPHTPPSNINDESFSPNSSEEEHLSRRVVEEPPKIIENKYEVLSENVQNTLDKITVLKPSKTKLKLKVNRVTLTASWKWQDSKDDDDACGICRGAFEACCTNCKMPGDGCPIALGDCKHPFHLHCINKWTDSQPNPSCPLCRTEWKSVVAPAAAAAQRNDHLFD